MYISSSTMEGKPKRNKQNSKIQDTESAPSTPKRKNTGDVTDQENSSKRKKEHHQGTDDITADAASPFSIILYQEYNENIKKSHKAKDTKRIHKKKHFTEETLYSELADLEDSSKKQKKKVKNRNNSVEDSVTIDIGHTNKKQKGGINLAENSFTEELVSQRQCPKGSETPKLVDEGVDQSLTAANKKKRKRKHGPHQETTDITAHNASSPIVLYQEEHENIQITHKSNDPKRLGKDSRLLKEALCREAADIKGRQRLKKKKRHLLADSSAEELLITDAQHGSKKKTKWKDGGDESHKQQDCTEEREKKRKQPDSSETKEQMEENMDQAADRSVETLVTYDTQHVKKKKKRKDGGGVQDDGLTEELSSHRKSQETQEQVDRSLDQIEKPKKKKKRKYESPQEVKDIAVDDASSSAAPCGDEASYDTEDRTRRKKKKKSKKDQSECPVEEWNHDAQCTSKKKREKTKRKDGGDESHSPCETETVDQAEVHVRKKKKKKKHSHSREDTSDIRTEETQPEDDGPAVAQQSSPSQEGAGNMEGDGEDDTEQTSTSGQSRHQTSVPTGADQNPTTQDEREEVHNEGGDRLVPKEGRKRKMPKMPSIREQDLALLEEYIPNIKNRTSKSMYFLIVQELERIRIAKQKGIVFHNGLFTAEEDEQIKKNVEQFMSRVGIESAEMLFHPYKFPEQKKTIRELRTKFQFLQRIAEGLYRTTRNVFDRGMVLYENSLGKGRFSNEEVRQLKKHHELHGNDWRTIGSLMNRSASSSRLRVAVLRHDVNRGVWSIEEKNRLIAAVKENVLNSLEKVKRNNEDLVTVPKRKLYTGINWVQIADKVETRNYKFCLQKWCKIVLLRMNYGIHPFKETLGIQNNIKIIKWMYDSKTKETRDIKWDKLCEYIGNVTKHIIQKKFLALKGMIDGWRKMRLHEIVDLLYNEKLPELEQKLFAAGETPIEPEKKDEFLISEIFQEWSELDEIWSDASSATNVDGEGPEGHTGDTAWSQCTDVYG
ncbi:LOW QUALITY PROTEIN: transcription termination factor 1-like [Dendropsophus ebraccatus]|uniref:LOW QUALITY PROTEIN: transcription termination factor 1-like n=1 Tax=Dendropsophus ebraccatus TaxID=150705 RepID=UPI003831AA42